MVPLLRRLAIVGAIVLLPFTAQSEETPTDIVRHLYAPYLKCTISDDASCLKIDSSQAVMRYASRKLRQLLQKDRDCETTSHGICNLDWDIIISGQDSQIYGLKIHSVQKSSGNVIVHADFTDEDYNVQVTYFFVREDGHMRIDNIVAEQHALDKLRHDPLYDSRMDNQKWNLIDVLKSPL